MKRLSTIIMALALVLGMSQCKKQETPTNGDSGEKVYVTLNVSNGESLDVNVNDNGGRHAVAPNLGVIQFRNGDVLYVGHDGKYIGRLTYNSGAFGGTLSAPTGDDYLHFYFLGNAALSEALPETIAEGTEITTRTINIADQRQNLPVLCYGASSQKYKTTTTNYSAVLEYKCALVRFNLQNQVYMNVNLSNVLTEATIDFANNAITPITTSTGTMTLYGEEGVITHRWGILLPGTTLTGNSDLEWKGTGSMPTIVANGYVDAGVGAGFLIHNPSLPAPTTDVAVHNGTGLTVFSVSPTQKVYFSKANLKYTPGSNTWEFHNSQVDECYGQLKMGGSSYKPSYRPEQSKSGQAWVQGGGTSSMDRFCWGYNDEDNTLDETDFIEGRKDLSRTFGTDWGCAFPQNTYWRTPTASEWDYLLNNTARGNKRFMMVKFLYHKTYSGSKVYESYCNGLMLFPDNFDESGLQLSSNFNTDWYNQTDAYHVIDAAFYDDSESNMYKLLNAGVVFLPAVGMRAGGTDYYGTHSSSDYYIYDYYESEAGTIIPQGYYWTASCDGYETWSKYLWIGVTGGMYYAVGNNTANATETLGVRNTMENVPRMREIGMCVRLVWDAN